MLLIDPKELLAAQERYLAKQADDYRKSHGLRLETARNGDKEQHRVQEVHSSNKSVYQVRSAQQWEDRAHQSFDLRIGKQRQQSRDRKPLQRITDNPAVCGTTESVPGGEPKKKSKSRKKKTAFQTGGELFPPRAETTTGVSRS
jgi:hypothetical protein